jgi:hypothetical protein
MGEERIACIVLIGEPEGTRPQGQPGSRREISNKNDQKGSSCGTDSSGSELYQ